MTQETNWQEDFNNAFSEHSTTPNEGQPQGTPPGESTQTPPDPLAEVTIEQLIAHPRISRQIQSRLDQIAAKQVQSALERQRVEMQDEARLIAAEARFSAMTPDELGEELTNPQSAELYSYLHERRRQERDNKAKDELAVTGEIHSIAQTIHVYSSLVNESQLPAEVKASLDPNLFKDQGLAAYQSAVFKEFVKYEGQRIFEQELKKNLDAETQARLATTDPLRPTPTRGVVNPVVLPVMETASSDLITAGLLQRANRNGGK